MERDTRSPKCFLLAVLLTFLISSTVWADVTGSILGTVRDTTAAVVAGANVVATNLDTNEPHPAVSDALGNYRMLALPVGHYKVEASLAGFQKFATSDIVLTVNEQRRIDITLQVGSIEQTVEVNTASVQVETTNTQLGEVIESKKLLALPLNGRSYVDLLGLQAGVAPITSGSMQQDRPVSGGLSAGNVSVNGQRETANAFLINGGDVSEGRNLGAGAIPNLDSVEEFRLITNSFDAEYGRFSGAIMNVITKSGTNAIHGSAFEFLRNDKMDARGFFDPDKAELRRNQFGFATGGPAIKNKLFWFTDYQGTREVNGASTGIVSVPTVAMRNGNFAGLNAFVDADGQPALVKGDYWASVLSQKLGYTVRNNEPYSPQGCTLTSDCVFPGGIVPQRAFAAPVAAMMQYIPAPNFGDSSFTSSSEKKTVHDNKLGERVDFINKMTGNWSFYYHYDDSTLLDPLASASVPGFAGVTPTRAQQVVMSNTKVLGPTTVNEWRVSFFRTSTTTNKPVGALTDPSQLGFVTGEGTLGIITSGPYTQVPGMNFNAFSTGNAFISTTQPNNTWHFSDSFSKIIGRHALKFGGEFRYLQINERNVCAPTGVFTFNGTESGSDWADFLIGAPQNYNQCSMQFLDSRSRYGGAFAQDAFRIKPNLTLNLGVRWEVSMPWYDTQDKIETIVPGLQSTQFPTAPKGWVVPGDPGIPSTLAPTRYNNFGPRVGLAYSPGFTDGALGKIFGGPGKTSIRMGFGLYYTSIEDLNLFYEVGDAPYGQFWNSPTPPMFDTPFLTRSNGVSQVQRFPFIFPVPGAPENATLDYSKYLPISYSPGYDIHNRLPYAEHYNFTIQREISKSTVLTVGFVGTQGHKLISQYDANPGNRALCLSLMGSGVMPGTPECGPNGEQADYTRPDGTIIHGTRDQLGPAFGYGNSFTVNVANSNYNSLQVSLERKAADVTFHAAYTFSKAIDNSSGFGEWVNFTNYRLSRSLSSFDLTHNFVFSYNWELPFAKWFSSGPKRLTQGWNIVGITRFATGFPISLSQSEDRSLVGSGATDVPNVVSNPSISDPRHAGPSGLDHQYFSPESFTTGTFGTFGDSNRRFFHGPGIINTDFGLHKIIVIREAMSVRFAAEFFNVFNHAQFNNPVGSFSDPLFGSVTSARPPRIGQMSLKFLW